MTGQVTDSTPVEVVRHIIARALIGNDSIADRLGEIVLRPHQRRAADKLAAMIAAHGGAMLAEPVGVGKTYTALAVAAVNEGPIVVATPSSLQSMWRDAAHRCGLAIDIVTHETLSRGTLPATVPRFVIVDEAHRLRSPTSRRYALLADLCCHARVLLVTATPVQNRRADLAAQLALFLGRVAWAMSDEDLVQHVVRDTGSVLGARPRLDGPHRVALGVEDDCLDQLLSLPPAIPAKDESTAAALLTYGLLHQWTSSRAALEASLGRRRARGLALSAAVEAGRRPTRAELSAWAHADDSLQLAFPEIVAVDTIDGDGDGATLLVALERHGTAIEALLHRLRSGANPDAERVAALRRIRAAHPGERIIAFSHYAETVGMLRSRLSYDSGIATLTAAGARVAGGRLSREDVLAQFTPSRRPAHQNAAERIDLLITTDLLSEGLNLQEASVIVHLDLPWNPARLDQRVGRALRLGSRHEAVTVYAIAPPAPPERLLRIESRLREKLSVAQRTVGVAGRILPSAVGGGGGSLPAEQGLAEQRGAFEAELRGWVLPRHVGRHRTVCAVAAVGGETRGYLALVQTGRGARIVADIGAGAATTTTALRRAIAACSGDESAVDFRRVEEVVQQLTRWLAAQRGATTVDLAGASAARSRRAALTRVAQALSRSPRHRQSQLAPLADAARAVASAPLGEGAERILETLVRAELPDEAWLRSIAAFGELNVRPAPARTAEGESEVLAVILFGPS